MTAAEHTWSCIDVLSIAETVCTYPLGMSTSANVVGSRIIMEGSIVNPVGNLE